MAYVIKLKDLERTLRNEIKLDRKAVIKALQFAASRAAKRLKQYAKDKIAGRPRAFNKGHYVNSIRTRHTKDGAIVGTASPYALIIEFGRAKNSRPPPIDAIAAWILEKGLLDESTAKSVKKQTKKAHGSAAREYQAQHAKVRGLAFVIARSIAKEGISPKHIFSNNAHLFYKYFDEELNKEFKRLGYR